MDNYLKEVEMYNPTDDKGANKAFSDGLFNFNFNKLDNAVRKISLDKPWVKMLLLGIPSYFAGKAITPKMVGLLSPSINRATGIDFSTFDQMKPEDQKFIKRLVGSTTALAAMAPTFINNIDLSGNKKYFGLNEFSPKTLNKTANFNPYNPMQVIPLSTAKESIINHPTLTPMTKATSYAILNTFPNNATVTGKDIVDRAVSSGISGACKFAAGFTAAHALGLPNPYTTAAIFTGLSSLPIT